VFVAEDTDGSVIGFVSVGSRLHWSGETDAYVGELAVAECASRRGVGTALMRAVEDWGHSCRYRRLLLETGAANIGARGFYRSRNWLKQLLGKGDREPDTTVDTFPHSLDVVP
jgi:ribosomal protein S18 acetylase RimI-like enzyme